MFRTVASYARILNCSGTSVLCRIRLIDAKAPVAFWILCFTSVLSSRVFSNIVPRYLKELQNPKYSCSLSMMSAVSLELVMWPGAGINIASVLEASLLRLSPQCTVRPKRLKCVLISLAAASRSSLLRSIENHFNN